MHAFLFVLDIPWLPLLVLTELASTWSNFLEPLLVCLGSVITIYIMSIFHIFLSRRLKQFEPLDTRDFFPFAEYDDLMIENIKEACEKYYQAPEGSCDILASDRGPSCTKLEQIKGEKVYFIRFLQPTCGIIPKAGQPLFEKSFAPPKQVRSAQSPVKKPGNLPTLQSTVFPKSVSVTDLVKAGKLVKPPATNMTMLDLETFELDNYRVKISSVQRTVIEDT